MYPNRREEVRGMFAIVQLSALRDRAEGRGGQRRLWMV
jgi:hypothetical protein